MASRSSITPWIATIALLGWTALWFWAFSFAWSDDFFRYNPHSRIPTFAALLAAVVLIPVSAFYWWYRAGDSAFRPVLYHLISCLAILVLPLGVSAFLARAEPPWRLEADDVMGVGIDLLILVGIVIASVALLGAAQWRRRHRRKAGP